MADDENGLSRAAQMTKKKTKRAEGIAPFDPGIRFSTVAVDILGLMTMATSIGAKHMLVMTDLITMYMIAVPLVSTDSADMAREILENWVLRSSKCATYRSRKKFWWQNDR